MCSVLKQEFQVKNFGFSFQKEEALYTAQWKWPPAVFVVYRVCVALYLLGFSIYMLIVDNKSVLFIFLTNWTFLFETVTFVIGAVVAVVGYAVGRKLVGPRRGRCELAAVTNGNALGHADPAKEDAKVTAGSFGSTGVLVAGDKGEGGGRRDRGLGGPLPVKWPGTTSCRGCCSP